MKRVEATIYGHVQGVFFRDTTRSKAQQWQLAGWVRNEPDGSVRVVAEGSEEALERLLSFLHEGPPSARVERVEAEWADASGDFAGFRVRR